MVEGVACHFTVPERGGVAGALGVAEEVSDISLACRQIGPIAFKEKFEQGDVVFRERRSIFFKKMQIVRGCDVKRNVLVYLVYSDKLVEGSPKNSTSTVPIMPWGAATEPPKCADWRGVGDSNGSGPASLPDPNIQRRGRSALTGDFLEPVAEVLVADGAGADQAGRRGVSDIVGFSEAHRRGVAFPLAEGVGRGLAAALAPAQAPVEPVTLVLGLVVSHGRGRRRMACDLVEAVAEALIADRACGKEASRR